MACSRQPEVLWAQCSKKVYLTISVPDSEDVVIKTEPQGIFSFSAVAHGESFSLALELFDSVLPEATERLEAAYPTINELALVGALRL
uniref:Co-chaperone protein p23 n=1 Tax=Aegilops tauschii subsp. strangulata TaxID=200361 RepID=A0A453I4B5_AEGTS